MLGNHQTASECHDHDELRNAMVKGTSSQASGVARALNVRSLHHAGRELTHSRNRTLDAIHPPAMRSRFVNRMSIAWLLTVATPPL